MTQDLKSVTAQWINVEEHLPEDGRRVMVCGYITSSYTNQRVPEVSIGVFNPKRGWQAEIREVEYWTEMPSMPIGPKLLDYNE